jgi:hypothetical protein
MGRSTVLGSLTSIAIIGASGYCIWRFALNSPTTVEEAQGGAKNLWEQAKNIDLDDFTKVLEGGLEGLDFGGFFNNDPKLGDNTTYLWESSLVEPTNGGLHLSILNALDDTWQQEFEEALSDWQQSPALTLDLQRVEVDHNCNRMDGVMVVCNANFGETGWVGINENEIAGDRIMSSVAKMNEYYLRNAEYEHRRYTMCHEVGHGFGLPHTDENPYNANLGNCLDYTDDPAENLHPGDVNFKKIIGMYLSGSRRTTRRLQSDGRIIESHMLVVDPDLAQKYIEGLEN